MRNFSFKIGQAKIGQAMLLGLVVFGFSAISQTAAANDQVKTVKVSSLTVKERLASIEQLVVSAEKQPLDIEPSSEAVKDLLAELDELEADEKVTE